MTYDLIIRGGTVATASESFIADVAIAGETIAAIGRDLGPATREIDARGRYVLPGGVDTHSHIEQLSSGGIMNADTFESATISAAFGGTTTVISFAAQHVGMSLTKVVGDYHALAKRGAVVDYAFHMILADPTDVVLNEELPPLVKAGHSSLKLFMTYDRIRLDDEKVLDLLMKARELGAFVMAHAENHGMISWLTKRLLDRGYAHAKYHAIAHARASEPEAFQRFIAMAELVDQPVMLYHVSTKEGAEVIRAARGRGVKLFAETCPQYLFLTRHDLDRPGNEGARFVFSPPARETEDQEALWRALSLGDLQVISSDHAPYALDATGKFRAGPDADFKQVASGLPGFETRLPVLFDAMVSQGRFSICDFVKWTTTDPAKIYGLHPKKGAIAIGADADIAIWNPGRRVTLSDAMMHDKTGYTPFAGREIRGWPEIVLRRGAIIVENNSLTASAGSGQFLPRSAGEAARPRGVPSPEFDPARNFGAKLD